MQITVQFVLALDTVSRDPEVREALMELDDVEMLTELFGDATDEHTAAGMIKAFALREARKQRVMRRDLALRYLRQVDRDVLGLHPDGRELLSRMAVGDQSAVEPARALLAAIRKERAALGLD